MRLKRIARPLQIDKQLKINGEPICFYDGEPLTSVYVSWVDGNSLMPMMIYADPELKKPLGHTFKGLKEFQINPEINI